jgi:nucleotide-binding universal stress UspA family protein
MSLRRILVGLDGSPLAESILAMTRLLAGPLGAEVTLLHVTDIPESFRAVGEATLDGLVERERRAADRYLHRIVGELHDAGIAARTAVAVGGAAAEIVRTADREDSDLLALATHGRSGMQRSTGHRSPRRRSRWLGSSRRGSASRWSFSTWWSPWCSPSPAIPPPSTCSITPTS